TPHIQGDLDLRFRQVGRRSRTSTTTRPTPLTVLAGSSVAAAANTFAGWFVIDAVGIGGIAPARWLDIDASLPLRGPALLGARPRSRCARAPSGFTTIVARS